MSECEESSGAAWACASTGMFFAAAFLAVGVSLARLQITSAADSGRALDAQSLRRIQTESVRGRICDRNGVPLADNNPVSEILLNPFQCRRSTEDGTVAAICEAMADAAEIVGRAPEPSTEVVRRHVRKNLARPLVVWRGVTSAEEARFFERESEMPGFSCETSAVRTYPLGAAAAHIVGYVGHDAAPAQEGDVKFNFRELEMRGRSGLEYHYDSFLRGAPGENAARVDARGFTFEEWTVVPPAKGPDLRLTVDSRLQRVAAAQLEGVRGACVVMDADTGEILAMASAPSYDPSRFVPYLGRELYRSLCEDPSKPLLDRAVSGVYAPGSTFKLVTALAALGAGIGEWTRYECIGEWVSAGIRIRCSRTWGHGELDLRDALKESCNPYFCRAGVFAGTNALFSAARALGLGAKTGIDFPAEAAGVVPDAAWKQSRYGTDWSDADLAHMSIGQGMLLVTPLQMARTAAAIGTGVLVTPVLRLGARGPATRLPFPESHLEAVRDGMRLVVERGSGKPAGEGVAAEVTGKTGTAEVGAGAYRRKNAWFIAFAKPLKGVDARRIAVALVVENGQSGGATAAPRVREILKAVYGESGERSRS